MTEPRCLSWDDLEEAEGGDPGLLSRPLYHESRFTPAMIAAAYAATGLLPGDVDRTHASRSGVPAHPLVALARARGHATVRSVDIAAASALSPVSMSYLLGFDRGWYDQQAMGPGSVIPAGADADRYDMGRRDGRSARAHLLPMGSDPGSAS